MALLTLQVERPVAGGRMLARHEGRVVLVSGAIAGERVTARLEKSTKQVAFAATVEVLDASPWRRPPLCDPACGGSTYAHITIEGQRELKAAVVADAFRRLGKITLDQPVPVVASPETGYRLRGRLHVRDGRAGFFREHSHRLCDAGRTRQFSDDTMPAVDRVLDLAGPSAADCEAIIVGENVAASQRVCHLEPYEGRRLDRADVAWALVDAVNGITTRVGNRLVTLAGEGRVSDTAHEMCGAIDAVMESVAWTRTAASFFQGNRYLTGTLLQRVLALAQGERVLDLYAGVGLFAVALAARGATITAVEGDATSVADLEINAEPYADRLTIRQAAVEAAVATMGSGQFDTVVLDPPRTGASPEALAGTIALASPRIVYVSCDPATLARDAAILTKHGYRLSSIEAFDMFPNTAHIEALAMFDR